MQELLDCGHPESEHSKYTRGYGIDRDGKKHCYACCADMDRKHMIEHGKIVLYMHNGEITDWHGTLRFKHSSVLTSWHNMAGTRYDTWFVGPDNHIWHAYRCGDNTEIAHCKRTKETVR